MTNTRSALLIGVLLVTSLGGCAAASGASPSATQPPPTAAPPTQVPGGEPSDPGSGVVDPNPGGGGLPGAPRAVVPKPGTIDPHPVSVETLEAQVTGRSVVIVATWWSGEEPCYTLDTVAVKRDGDEFTVALTEGSAERGAMCIEIAVQKSTAIDLGELEPGQYVVSAQDSTAAPVSFTVD